MEVQYELTCGEYKRLTIHNVRTRFGKVFVGLFLFLFAVIFFPVLQHQGFITALIVALLQMIVPVSVWLIFMHFMLSYTYRSLKQSPGWGKVKVRLEADHIASATHYVKSEVQWEAVSKIAEDAQAFYLHLNVLQIIMVPRRAFANAAEAQQFWTLAQEYHRFAKTAAKEPVRI